MLKFTGGTAEGGDYKLIPETDDVIATLTKIEPYPQNKDRLKFVFRIDDYDEDEADEAFAEFLGKEHWESANIPNNKLNSNHRLHEIVSGLIGHTLQDGEDVDVEEYIGKQFKVDFKHVPKKKPNGDGSFGIAKDDQGKVIMKAQISKIKPIKKSRKSTAPNPFQDEEAA